MKKDPDGGFTIQTMDEAGNPLQTFSMGGNKFFSVKDWYKCDKGWTYFGANHQRHGSVVPGNVAVIYPMGAFAGVYNDDGEHIGSIDASGHYRSLPDGRFKYE